MVTIPLTPVPKPRMVKSDRWRKRPATDRYWAFKDELLSLVKGSLEPNYTVRFYLPMPASWPKKKRELLDGRPHQQKPDIDNLIKSLQDCLCEEDSYIFEVHASKFWAAEGRIEIEEGLSGLTK